MATLPDVIATYALDGDHYRRVTANTAAMTGHERLWWQEHGQEIVDTMAAPYAADVVGLLRDNTSYGVAGDHGGAQQPVQQIPIVFAGAGVGKKNSKAPMRSVDILPTILQQMGIAPHADLDGQARAVPAG
jgi:arylsulfatase A-like enzyme